MKHERNMYTVGLDDLRTDSAGKRSTSMERGHCNICDSCVDRAANILQTGDEPVECGLSFC